MGPSCTLRVFRARRGRIGALLTIVLPLLACSSDDEPATSGANDASLPDTAQPARDSGSQVDSGGGEDAGPVDASADAAPSDATADVATNDAGSDAAPLDAGKDTGPADAAVIPGAKVVFVTTTAVIGSFGGWTQGDALCHTEALAAGLSGTFVAWLSLSPDTSDGGSTPRNAIDRLTSDGPFTLVDRKTLLFGNKAAITSGAAPVNPVTRTASGATIANGTHVWTGTTNKGVVSVPYKTCGDWTNSSNTNLQGFYGDPTSNLVHLWSAYDVEACDVSNRLYCFEN